MFSRQIASAADSTAILFDAQAGTVPSSQGWAFLTDPLFLPKSKQTVASGTAILDSTAVTGEKAGWFSNLPPFPKHPRQPTLEADPGFVLSFVLRVGRETHNRPERAGFSVIATAANLSAIELGFWTNSIWAQSGPDFLHAESATIDTTTGLTRFDLVIQGDRYRLSTGGQGLLDGPLRRYDSFGAPYNIPEFLFLGDDTTSAAGQAELSRVTVGPLPRVQVSREGPQVILQADAETGRTVEFEGSEDLVTWVEAGTATSVDGEARLALSADAPLRFFRSRLR